MNEKEKMLKGELYNSQDIELIDMRKQARLLFEQYNRSSIKENKKRYRILNKLIGRFGDNLYIEPPFYCDYGKNIELGDNVYMNFNCIFLDVCKIKIGNNVLFGPNVSVLTATHPVNAQERISNLELGKPIGIGNNCWIGAGAMILPGVTIGDNTTIGAGSIVNKDIPSNVLAVGNPCKIVKKI